VNDAMYWQAFALYRIGGTPELQEALGVLETLKAKAPAEGSRNAARSSAGGSGGASGGGKGSSSGFGSASAGSSPGTTAVVSGNTGDRLAVDRYNTFAGGVGLAWVQEGGRNDATALAARIANVLASRGMSNDPAVKRAQAAAGNNCDTEDQQVRAEALSALGQTDPEMARQSAVRALGRKDECSVPLRRTAIGMIANKKDDAAAAALIPVAKSDPSVDVRTTAIDYLSRMPGDAALNTLQELSTVSDNDRVQRSAIRALASSTNPRAKVGLRALIEKNDAPEPLRLAALDSYGRESAPDDIAWLRGTYTKVTSARVKSSIVSAVARIGGDANDAWLSTLLRNDDEPMEARMSALRQAGRSMDVGSLAKLYDASTQRQIRSQVIELLGERKESAAVDKLIDIAKTGTDPGMRRSAISVLARSKDPRAQKLLLDLVDHE
jgi:HEAT repeat protein